MRIFIAILLFAAAIGAQQGSVRVEPYYPVSEKEAAKVVAKVLKVSPVIDGHNDLFIHFFACKECPRDFTKYRIDVENSGHTDIPRWRKGGVGATLLNIERDDTLDKFLSAYDIAYRMQTAYPKDLKVVKTSTEMRQAMRDGRIALLPIMENSVGLENSMYLLRSFYQLGLRGVTLAYKTNDLADGSDDKPKHNGVSAFGREMIREMNRLGVIVDISHVSAKAMSDALETSLSPVIFSHSNSRRLCDINRNVPDDVLLKLKANGGMIMLTMVPEFTTNPFAKWMVAGDEYYYGLQAKYSNDKKLVKADMDIWEKANPFPPVTIGDIAEHFDHVKKLIGVDHIGIGGDYDGISYTIKGMEDVSKYPSLLTELAHRGWTEKELRKVTGENLLRVFAAIETKATQLQTTMQPSNATLTVKK
ncbi:MAG: dipeptidase [Pyrinomonadaceae bacterium]